MCSEEISSGVDFLQDSVIEAADFVDVDDLLLTSQPPLILLCGLCPALSKQQSPPTDEEGSVTRQTNALALPAPLPSLLHWYLGVNCRNDLSLRKFL